MRLTAVRHTRRPTSTEERSGRAGPRRHRLLAFASAAALATAALAAVAPRVSASTEVGDAGDLPATAQVIATADTQIDGSLGANDIDLYQFCVDGGPFSAEVTSYGDDSVLYLFGPSTYYVHYDDDGGDGFMSLLELADLPAGTYHLAIGAYWSEPNNSPWHAPTETLTSWPETGPGTETGAYTIALDGLSAAPCTVPPVNTTDLYAVGYATGGAQQGGAPSSLYSVDPNTGSATLIGPIEVAGTQLAGITGIDFGLDGLLYAVDNANQRLLTLDTATGAATVIGPYGSDEGWMPDIAFDAYGYLYGWDESSDDLVRIYANGTTRWIGPSGISTLGTGLVVDASNDMYVKDGEATFHRVSQQTGNLIGDPTVTFGYLDGLTSNPADFDGDDGLYTVVRPESQGYTGAGSVLETLDPATGLLMAVGYEPDVMITGLAFDTGTTTSPGDSTGLGVTVVPTPFSVTIGDDVDLAVTVRNDGPSAALVTVTAPLPAGLTYVTHSGGTYDSTTGVWAVGTLAVGNEASLVITATGTAVGWPTIQAVASADVYVPGPAADIGVVGVYATTPGTPTDAAVSAGDGRAQLSWTAPYDGGAAITEYRIYTCTGAACTAGTGTYTTATASPVTLTGLANGTVHGFAVQAVNSAGAGTASATVYATPQYASATISSAVKAQGKVTVTFTPAVPPLEVALGTPLTYQVSGPKAGTWLSCTPLPSTTTCVVKTSAKSVAIRVSTTNGSTWGPVSSAVKVTR